MNELIRDMETAYLHTVNTTTYLHTVNITTALYISFIYFMFKKTSFAHKNKKNGLNIKKHLILF